MQPRTSLCACEPICGAKRSTQGGDSAQRRGRRYGPMALAPRDVDMARYSWLTIEVANSMRPIEILWIRTPPPSDFEARPPRRLRYSPKLTTSRSPKLFGKLLSNTSVLAELTRSSPSAYTICSIRSVTCSKGSTIFGQLLGPGRLSTDRRVDPRHQRRVVRPRCWDRSG